MRRLTISSTWKKTLAYLTEKIRKSSSWVGDINCDLSIIEGSDGGGHSSNLKELYDLFRLKKVIEEPTRVTIDTSTLKDTFPFQIITKISESGVIKTTFNDYLFRLL